MRYIRVFCFSNHFQLDLSGECAVIRTNWLLPRHARMAPTSFSLGPRARSSWAQQASLFVCVQFTCVQCFRQFVCVCVVVIELVKLNKFHLTKCPLRFRCSPTSFRLADQGGRHILAEHHGLIGVQATLVRCWGRTVVARWLDENAYLPRWNCRGKGMGKKGEYKWTASHENNRQ